MSVEDEHPYDGQERRYRHDDPHRARGLQLVAKLLRLADAALVESANFDLSFYSGGMGVVDRLAIHLQAPAEVVEQVVRNLEGVTPEVLALDPVYAEEFLWLVSDDGNNSSPWSDSVRFVNQERKAFQPLCDDHSRVFFTEESNVNDWTVLWTAAGSLNYLGYSQG